MKRKTITLQEYKEMNPKYEIFERYEDIPEILKDIIYEKILRNGIYTYSADDMLEHFEKGKDWIFEELYKYQPKTAKLLKERGTRLIVSSNYKYILGDSRKEYEKGCI